MTIHASNDRAIPVADDLIAIAKDNFKFYALEIRNRQTTIQNIYFWIASALFTVYAAAFKGAFTGNDFIHLGIFPHIQPFEHKRLIAMAFILCAWVIFTGVDAMRGRGQGHRELLGSYSTLAMLESYLRTPNLSEMDIRRHFLKECETNIQINAQDCVRMGRHLRRTSVTLLTSMSCGLFAFLI